MWEDFLIVCFFSVTQHNLYDIRSVILIKSVSKYLIQLVFDQVVFILIAMLLSFLRAIRRMLKFASTLSKQVDISSFTENIIRKKFYDTHPNSGFLF